MSFRLAPIAPVLLGVVSAQVALGIMTPLIPLLLMHGGTSAANIGLIASFYYVGFLLGALNTDRIVTEVGHIRGFAVFAAVAADGALVMVLTDQPWVWAVMRAMIGYCNAGISLVAESWLNERTDSASRGRTLGAYMVASWGGGVAGPLLLDAAAPSPLLFVAVGLAFVTAVLPMALTHQPNPEIRRNVQLGFFRLLQISPTGVACCLTAGLVNSVYYSLMPVYLTRRGHDASAVASFAAATNVAGLAVQLPVGFLSDRIGRRPVAVAVLVSACAAAVLMDLRGGTDLAMLMTTGCIFAGLTAPMYGLGSSLTNDRLEHGQALAASGSLLFAWSVGSTLGPSVAGAMMGRIGPSGLFIYLAAVLGGIGLFISARMLLRDEVPREQRSVFVPAATAPPRVSELVAPGRPAAEELLSPAETIP